VMLLLLGETADALHKAQRVGEVGALECAGDPGSIVDEIPVGRLPAVIFGLLARKRRDTTSARRARPFSKVGGHPAFLLAAIEEGTTRAIIKRQPAFGGRWRHSCSVVYGCGMHFGLFSRLRRVEQTGTRGAAQAGVGSGTASAMLPERSAITVEPMKPFAQGIRLVPRNTGLPLLGSLIAGLLEPCKEGPIEVERARL
jgi:hypothetical protein